MATTLVKMNMKSMVHQKVLVEFQYSVSYRMVVVCLSAISWSVLKE